MNKYQNSRLYSDCIKVINMSGSGSKHHHTGCQILLQYRDKDISILLQNQWTRWFFNKPKLPKPWFGCHKYRLPYVRLPINKNHT